MVPTGLRLALVQQTWHAAQFTPISAFTVLGIGLLFDLVTLGLLLPGLLNTKSLLGTRKHDGAIRLSLILLITTCRLLALGYLTPDQLIILGPGNKIEDWHLNQQQALTTPVIQPGPRVNRARRLSGDCTPRT